MKVWAKNSDDGQSAPLVVSPPMESGSFGTLSMSNPEFLQMIRKAHLKYKK